MAGTDYVVNPLDATSPLDTNVARKGAAELRALKLSVNTRLAAILPPAINEIPVRQTVLGGPITAAGVPSMLAIGAGLNVDLKATAVAVTMAFAGGFGALGATDYVEQYVADVASYWPLLPASNTSYLTSTRTGAGVTVTGQTLAPPQYGDTYNQAAQSVLQFAGAAGAVVFLDDFGNTWTAQGGAKVQTNQFKFGTGGLGGAGGANVLNGAADYIKTVSVTSLGNGSWSMRGWFYFTALPGAFGGLFFAANAAGYGAGIDLASTGKLRYLLSSTGAANDIANGIAGTITITTNAWHFVELTYDALAGIYRLYVDGVADGTTVVSTSKICAVTQMLVGSGFNPAQTFMTGYADKFEFIPYCNHSAGTAYAVPVAAPSITAAGYSSDWFDTAQMLMKTPSAASAAAAANPAFTTSNKLYVGEADTSGAAVTAVRTYAYRGKYTSDDFTVAASTLYTKAANLGIIPKFLRSGVVCQTNNGYGYPAGSVIWLDSIYDTTSTRGGIPYMPDRNNIKYITGTNVWALQNGTTGAAQGLSFVDFKVRIEANRGW